MGRASGKTLIELLEGLPCRCHGDAGQVIISSLTADSRKTGSGTLFVAVAGLRDDGHRFVPEAIGRGCEAVVTEAGRPLPTTIDEVVQVEVPDSREALGRLAASFYGHPASELQMIGITGTNGKTTCAYLLEAILREAGAEPGVIGTVNYRYGGRELPAPFTTPEPVALQRLLRQMRDAGVTHVVMEVSSHALAQQRLAGVMFDLALFTNLSRDHLDFHGEMAAYFACKQKLFAEHLKPGGRAVVVETEADRGTSINWGCLGQILSCGLHQGCDVTAASGRYELSGLQAELHTPAGDWQLSSPLAGRFNLENILAAAGGAIALGLSASAIQRALTTSQGAPGRLERVTAKAGVEIFVDYAHTPAALENVLATLRGLNPRRLILVFGCGGDRDRGKRPLMGEIAGRLADVVLVTSDNPRSEEPPAIMADIEQGLRTGRPSLSRQRAEVLLQENRRRGYDLIESRREAIGLAIRGSRPGDAILISGKGHEDYQITRNGRSFFDDRLEVHRQAAVITW
ncbi:MAG: UDP-N-acetylmuramoyl-L-alanyl-D-glutamate--2,6-diaminopimelate ligase [Deltaproteobacteria bacterium]